MARLTREEVFRWDEIAIVHVMNRTVRRCFLMGTDSVSGKNFDHRKLWMEAELRRMSTGFGIDLLCYAIMSNHFHLVLRSRPDVVACWDDTEVARRWLMLCPVRKNASGWPKEPRESELDRIRKNRTRLKNIRRRLSNISWWMRLLSQTIAQRANHDDNEIGKFWQARYRAVRLLDDTAVLACAAYVDLNPIRAAMAETLEASDFTSVQARIRTLQPSAVTHDTADVEPVRGGSELGEILVGANRSERGDRDNQRSVSPGNNSSGIRRNDSHLAPVAIDELCDPLGPHCSLTGHRASDKGFLNLSTEDYLQLLDWTAREVRKGKSGATSPSTPPVFERLGLTCETWCELVRDFGKLFSVVAGKPHVIDSRRLSNGRQRHKAKPRARQLLAG